MPKTEDLIRKYALANAYSHDGKASPGAIIGKLIREDSSYAKKIKDLQPKIAKIVKEVNKLAQSAQKKELEKVYPEFFEKKEVSKDLPELPNAKKGKVVTRMAPEPNGHMHLGHAASFFFNHYYARKYGGKLIMRFEDTNPEKEEKEYYESIKEDVKWLGFEWDELKNNSDDLPTFYEYAEKLINKGAAYVCECPVEEMRANRMKSKECACRKNSKKENLTKWAAMLKDAPAGSAVLRFKGDMKAGNTVMRDPTLFRIVEAAHPLQGKKFRVWPLYDFANAIEDAICGITHVLRSNEFAQRDELQNKMRTTLGLKNPEIISYSRINVEDKPCSKRQILPLIEEGRVSGWDDPRLATIKGLKRRGIIPKTLHELGLDVRMTSGSTTISWKKIETINRKLLDAKADRYFFVPNPIKIEVEGAKKRTAKLQLHPDFPEKGKRELSAGSAFYVPEDDLKKLKKRDVFRLKDLYNVEYLGSSKAKFHSEKVIPDSAKIQWVPAEEAVEVKVLVPEGIEKPLRILKGVAEKGISNVPVGDIIQFERVGFCRRDSHSIFILSHK